MVVCRRQEFYKDLADNTNTRLWIFADRNGIEFLDHLPAHPLEFEEGHMLSGYKFLTFQLPFFMDSIHTSFCQFIWTHSVYAAHENITEYSTVSSTGQKIGIQLKARIGFQTV